MSGYYFISSDLRSTRAHMAQVLHTAEALGAHLPLVLVAPRYPHADLKTIRARHGLSVEPRVRLLWNFGLRNAGFLAFVLFNVPSVLFLIVQRLRGEVSFIYVRASYFLPLVLIARLLRVPCFFETHRKPMTSGERFREGAIARLSRGLVVVSAQVGQHFARFKKPMAVAHDAVDMARFAASLSREAARARLHIAPERQVCVYTGSVSNLKGVNFLVEAAKLLPDVSFLVAGRITADFREATLPENVSLLGELPQEELPALLRAADVLLLPHPKGEYSQSPMKLFEYMASGTPIVSTRLPPLEEVLTDDEALLVASDSGKALAEGIERTLEDLIAAAARAERAQREVQQYTWGARGKKIAEFIRLQL